MADWADLATTNNYAALISSLNGRDVDAACFFDPAVVTVTTPKTGTIRYNSANKCWEKYNGILWGNNEPVGGYAISITGSAGSVAWGNVSGKPTTLAGYGITDQVGLLGVANSWTAAQSFPAATVSAQNAIYTATGTTGWSGFSATKTVGQVALGIDDGVTFGRANGTAILRYGVGLSLVVQDSANSSPVTFSSTGVSVTGTVNISSNAINAYAATFTNNSTAGYGVLSVLGNTPATGQYFVGNHPVYGYSYQVFADGNVRIAAGATYGNLSDRTLKKNITDATPKLPDVMRLRVRNFSLKSDPTGARYIGWIAQEVEQVFPSLVIEQVNIDADGNEIRIKGIKESALIPILVKAVQEQQSVIDGLKKRLDAAGL